MSDIIDWLDECRRNVEYVKSGASKWMHQYLRNKRGKAKGIVTLFNHPDADDKTLYIGWSLCNKKDNFNKLVGLNKAILRSMRVDEISQGKKNKEYGLNDYTVKFLDKVPHSIKPLFEKMYNRAQAILAKPTGE